MHPAPCVLINSYSLSLSPDILLLKHGVALRRLHHSQTVKALTLDIYCWLFTELHLTMFHQKVTAFKKKKEKEIVISKVKGPRQGSVLRDSH